MHQRALLLLIAQIGLLGTVFSISAQSTTDQVLDPISTTDRLIEALIAKNGLPGVSVAIRQDGELLLAKGYGWADVVNESPVTPSSSFRTASVAKVMTATALGRLASQGKLDFDLPISTYVDYLPEHLAMMTTRQLASHTSGIRHYSRGDRLRNRFYGSIEEAVGVFSRVQPQAEVGQEYAYSTHGYTLLSAVIEGASGQAYLDYMQEEIFAPLGMPHSHPDLIADPAPTDVSVYILNNGSARLVRNLSDPSYKWAGAGFRTTPTDLTQMMTAYTNGFIAPEVVEDMFRSAQLNDGTEVQVGIGWRSGFDAFGRSVIEHAGNWEGARSVIVYYPAEKLSIGLMVNARWNSAIEETAHLIAAQFLQPSTEAPNTIREEDELRAVFTNSSGEVLEFSAQLQLTGQGGRLSVDTDREFLQDLPLVYIGYGNVYAAVSTLGLLYLELGSREEEVGKLYFYQNRLTRPPLTSGPILRLKL